ncbi:CRP-like cAMP-binding protein [Chitinophaga polysaccharea]|uniref:CRP-like cAMP-binding protein n=1 Tax=Chitinophaga polysaccharea TaxID=1293035 RepID=A0A561P7D3_9BACT|nr:Crp/Fnr family transcriptional regulator [Chitinophaga polysaccharea]TWF33984.1 CRP-like cAMP-binding protein [Chitinophaga polysaccharea]
MLDLEAAASQQVLHYMNTLTGFTAKDWRAIYPALTIVSFKKDDLLLEPGKVCDALYYICKGYCRTFYNKDGKEINTAFFFEDDIATNINSFARGERSDYAIQAAEPLTAIKFDKQRLYAAAAQDPDVETLGRKCLQSIAAKQEQHVAIYKLMTAQERYAYLAEHYPEMLQRVSLSQLSSYLGIARETLSRIRSRK